MDPLTAVGLASNILSFIDFAGKIVGVGHEIAKSAHGTTVGNHEIEVTTNTLSAFCKRLELPAIDRISTTKRSKTDLDIQDIASASLEIAEQLIKELKKVTFERRSNVFANVYYALKTVLHESDIESLRVRLERQQSTLQVALLLSLREKWEQSIPTLVQDLRSGPTLNRLKADILIELQKLAGAQKADRAALQDSLARHMSVMSRHESDEQTTDRIIEQLTFEDQDDRVYRIPEAHAATFRWILAPAGQGEASAPPQKWNDFPAWLRSDEHLYWITGKPGAGKSTLMKYVYARPECAANLRQWAKGSDLIITSFYFWNSGSTHQMSQEGLLRTILYQAFCQLPELVPSIFPKRWARFEMFGNDTRALKMPEILDAFHNLCLQASGRPFKLCMFVDGLDEFDGDQKALVQLFKQAVSQENVKACLSSRPWNVFEAAFESTPSLMLQDLTRHDIIRFIKASFDSDAGFKALSRRESSFASTLISDIAEKACGVFLWVDLVVKSLLDGMTNHDRISDLQRRLDEIPSDLEEFYRKILDSIEERYKTSAYRFLRLNEEAEGRLTALQLSFADSEPTEMHESAMSLPISPLSREDALYRLTSVKRRLNSTCKGFLELAKDQVSSAELSAWDALSSKISYHHRTARDFLQSSDIRSEMSTHTSDYDPALTLLTSAVCEFKCNDYAENERQNLFRVVVELAGNVSLPGQQVLQLLNEAQKCGEVLDVFSNTPSESEIKFRCDNCGAEDILFPEVAKRDFQSFVCEKILQNCCSSPKPCQLPQSVSRHLILSVVDHCDVFHSFQSSNAQARGLPDLNIFRHLLDLTSRPSIMNPSNGCPPLFYNIIWRVQNVPKATLDHWADLMAICLELGAETPMDDPTAEDFGNLLCEIFGKKQPERLDKLIEALDKIDRKWPFDWKNGSSWRRTLQQQTAPEEPKDGKRNRMSAYFSRIRHLGKRTKA